MSRTASNNTLTQKWLPLIVLIAALVITIALIRRRHAPTKHPFVDRGTLAVFRYSHRLSAVPK